MLKLPVPLAQKIFGMEALLVEPEQHGEWPVGVGTSGWGQGVGIHSINDFSMTICVCYLCLSS